MEKREERGRGGKGRSDESIEHFFSFEYQNRGFILIDFKGNCFKGGKVVKGEKENVAV